MSLPKEPCPAGPDVPREGSREIQKRGKVISVAYDWCNSKKNPVGYRIWCWQADAGNLANTVRQTDCRSHVVGSYVKTCYGDEPGTGGGVKSGTCQAECTLITGSPTVRAQDRPMGRRFDKWDMNHGNTWGCLENPEDTGNYNAPKVQLIKPELNPPDPTREDDIQAAAQGTKLAGPAPLQQPVPQPQPTPEPQLPANDNTFKPSSPPPQIPPVSSPIIGLGRTTAFTLPLMLGGDTPIPEPQITLPAGADPTQIQLFDQARNQFVPDTGPSAFAHNQEVERWYKQQMAAYDAHKKAKEKPTANTNSAVRVTSPQCQQIAGDVKDALYRNKRLPANLSSGRTAISIVSLSRCAARLGRGRKDGKITPTSSTGNKEDSPEKWKN